jgi:hypothetical protein
LSALCICSSAVGGPLWPPVLLLLACAFPPSAGADIWVWVIV